MFPEKYIMLLRWKDWKTFFRRKKIRYWHRFYYFTPPSRPLWSRWLFLRNFSETTSTITPRFFFLTSRYFLKLARVLLYMSWSYLSEDITILRNFIGNKKFRCFFVFASRLGEVLLKRTTFFTNIPFTAVVVSHVLAVSGWLSRLCTIHRLRGLTFSQ